MGDMSSKQSEKSIYEPDQEPEPVRQRSQRDEGLFNKASTQFVSQNSFDKISFCLVGSVSLVILVVHLIDVYILNIQWNAFSIFLALMTAVFTLLSVRESKRDREAEVAPTLFVGKREKGEYGVLNLGNGPAHELSVKVSTDVPDSWDNIEPELDDEILCVDGFLPIGCDVESCKVYMEYHSNVGKGYDVTRKVLSNDEG